MRISGGKFMAITINSHGHRLNSLEYINDLDKLGDTQDICGGNAILLYEGKLVLCWNKYRNNWELPGGGREKGEDLTKCVIREIQEEISQTITDLQICCLYKVFIPRINQEITGVTFYGQLNRVTNFFENEEMSKMILWDMNSDIGDIDEVDMKIVDFVLSSKDL